MPVRPVLRGKTMRYSGNHKCSATQTKQGFKLERYCPLARICQNYVEKVLRHYNMKKKLFKL